VDFSRGGSERKSGICNPQLPGPCAILFMQLNLLGHIEMGMRRLWLLLGIMMVFAPAARTQDEETARKLFEDAIQARGGEIYLNVKDMVSEGQYFVFDRDGASSGLIKFSDYTKLPDKSRFELGNRKKELEITVFNLEKNEGWILEGQKETKDATPEEMKSFENTVKHALDNILHFRYKDPANKLFYLGPGEGSEVTLEIVKIIDPENDETTVYFDRLSKLPAKVQYWSLNKRGIRQRMVDEYSQWHVIQGVKTPMRLDGYVNGRRASQTFTLKIIYNNNLPDSFFSKPIPPK
jgi:hypothetical protein